MSTSQILCTRCGNWIPSDQYQAHKCNPPPKKRIVIPELQYHKEQDMKQLQAEAAFILERVEQEMSVSVIIWRFKQTFGYESEEAYEQFQLLGWEDGVAWMDQISEFTNREI